MTVAAWRTQTVSLVGCGSLAYHKRASAPNSNGVLFVSLQGMRCSIL